MFQAGLKNENLLIALEPEAASLCCRHLPMDVMNGCASGFVPFSPGSKYLVFDAGGGFNMYTFLFCCIRMCTRSILSHDIIINRNRVRSVQKEKHIFLQ